MIQNQLASVKRLVLEGTNEHSEIVKYISDPFSNRLSKKSLIRWLKVLKMPSCRELIVIREAVKVMKSRG